MEIKIEKPELKVGDVIEIVPKEGVYKGMTLTCVVVDVMCVFDPQTLQPVNRVIIEYEVNGRKEQRALGLDEDYKVVSVA